MVFSIEPDVAFGMHPDLGVAAGVADDRPFLDEVLREHGFDYSKPLDIYLLPTDTANAAAIRAVASASRRFQDAGLAVVADPRLAYPEPFPRSGAAAGTAVPEAEHAAGLAEVLGQIRDKHHGTVNDIGGFIEAAADWYDRANAISGRDLADDLRAIALSIPTAQTARVRAATSSSPLRPPTAPMEPPTTARSDSPPRKTGHSR
ncbi:hypothetical protein [Streptomyces sp. G1]|uniref:hypothetical protein n=1 Tax=Streptomyces sp. G1 TaxID=361572 RepID=UPI002030D5F7|nr:hypothetical protein [Streptomyces sp. G1]MCM1967971.1 hypothetical protein [Streptomyces sp. G1]